MPCFVSRTSNPYTRLCMHDIADMSARASQSAHSDRRVTRSGDTSAANIVQATTLTSLSVAAQQVCLLAECPIAADFFALEILKSPPVTSDAPLNCPGYTVDSEYSKDKARVYQLSLEPGQSTGMHKLNFYGVVLSLSDGELSSEGDGSPFADGKLSKYGRFKWVEGPIEFSVKNEGEAVYKALVVEWLRHE
eukprot:TRINITY_DN907_c0_g1_i1.p1 TRINITY_DN907_c0_g1~~TRINITY_DN907_c0_g1_i1.p1  ORF type:complete len:192 (-),score=42.57 TRINITY_DN907_c0_g1_i1:394-969(-)